MKDKGWNVKRNKIAAHVEWLLIDNEYGEAPEKLSSLNELGNGQCNG